MTLRYALARASHAVKDARAEIVRLEKEAEAEAKAAHEKQKAVSLGRLLRELNCVDHPLMYVLKLFVHAQAKSVRREGNKLGRHV